MSSRQKVDLKVDWCSYQAARWAVEHWHYSKRMPKSKIVKLGAWEDGEFVGAVIFGVGATGDLVKGYGLGKNQGCELVRIALRKHRSPVSMILSIAISKIKAQSPRLRLIVSFADPEMRHLGVIYQASNWVYSGMSQASDEYIYRGRRYQGRSFRNKYKGMENHPGVTVVKGSSKHRYLYPLDRAMRRQIAPLAKPYPKRAGG